MWSIEPSSLGRIVVPPDVPAGYAVFATTKDFEGRINAEIAGRIESVAAERFGVDATLRTCTQIHSATVVRAPQSEAWRECDACDALWSDEDRVALGIKVADCLPVTMVDPVNRIIANVHSGWRGAVAGITTAALDAVQSSAAFDPSAAHAYLGPSIRSCCFEVGEEVAEKFEERFVERAGTRPHVDLVAFTRHVLIERGFVPSRVSDSGFCTRCDDSIFHSYRRQGAGGGRNLAIVAQ
jgi:YfiH family protein